MNTIPLWVIYRRPLDYPEQEFMARRWMIREGKVISTPDVMIDLPLEALREYFQEANLYRLPRWPDDDPVVHEVWI